MIWIFGAIVLLTLLRLGRDIAVFLMQRVRYRYHANNLRFLQIKMPRTESDFDKSNDAIQNMKQNIEVMNQVYKNFYAVYSGKLRDKFFGQPYISCELVVEKELIKFFLGVPKGYIETFEKLISSFYPGSVIDVVEQPSFLEAGKYVSGGYFMLTKDNALPIRQYDYFEMDPMDSILA